MNDRKKQVKEVIVVEGRDDEAAVKRAVCAQTIATHGFGVKKETWELLEKAYLLRGLILFTDPDFSGNEIRKKLTAKFPQAKQAYLSRQEAEKDGDIGIENASPEAITAALEKAQCLLFEKRQEFTFADLYRYGLCGQSGAEKMRSWLGRELGIGYANANTFLERLNQYGVTRELLESCLQRGQREPK